MKIEKIESVKKTKWVSLIKASYLDKSKKMREWNYISRNNDRKVVMIICKTKTTGKILFVAQPRVPLNKMVIGFPGGLIDDGETPEKAALRELKEETGYDAKVIKISPLLAKSSGLSDESNYLVECVTDARKTPEQELEDTEDIQFLWKTPKEYYDFCMKLDPNKFIVENDSWSYVLGYLNAISK